jgi:hypothetical protein
MEIEKDNFSQAMKVFEKLATEEFAYLQDLGYKYDGMKPIDTKSSQEESSIVHFTRDDRRVTISFFIDKENEKRDNSLDVVVWKPIDGKKGDRFEMLSLLLFLEDNVAGFDRKRLKYANFNGTFEERLHKMIVLNAKLLKKHLYSVLNGDAWYSEYFVGWS